jgi:hypothetical protein
MNKPAAILLALTIGCVGCRNLKNALGAAPHTYVPRAEDRAAYEFVHSHPCKEYWQPAAPTWDYDLGKTLPGQPFGAYVCDDVANMIIVNQEPQP